MTRDVRMTIGAVAYDPKVVTIWEGIRDYFTGAGLITDFALYSSYERQVEALLAGQVDLAWNTPLAHVRVRRRTGGTSRSLGMRDTDRDVRSKIIVRRDAGTSELDVVQAVHDGRAEAGAIGDVVWAALQAAGRIQSDLVEVMWTSPPFDHCMFDALASLPETTAEAFQQALFAMSWDDPRHRKILELEGLKQWLAPRESGYESLCAALDRDGAW